MPKARLRVLLNFRDERVAKAVNDALTPDNIDFPVSLAMEMRVKGSTLEMVFNSSAKFETLISTLDEILSHCQASLGVLEKS